MDSVNFKSNLFYSNTAKIQENTLLNRGILEIGGIATPHILMSNNFDERVERGLSSLLFFGISFLTPFVFIPKFNKYFLHRNGITKDFKSTERKILEVSKKYLTKDSNYMIKGINETAKNLDSISGTTEHQDAFNKILNRFSDKEELRQKLLKTHKNVYTADFLSSAWMICTAPWLYTEFTEWRTGKKGFSAAFNMKEQNIDTKKYKSDKYKKLLGTAFFATVPALLIPKVIMKGVGGNLSKYTNSKNIFKNTYGKLLNSIKNHADNFDYTKSIFMSKTIFALMWLTSDYPNCLCSARDKYERKDRAIRFGAMNLMFFGGDFVLNGLLGKLSDKFAKTKVMNGWQLRNLNEYNKLKGIDKKTLNRTKNAASAIYWLSILTNMALLGFALPKVLNTMLKNDIQKEKIQYSSKLNYSTIPESDKLRQIIIHQ